MTGVRVRIGVIGLGDIAVRAHLPAILREPRATLVAVAEIDPERLARHAPAGVRATATPQSVLEDPDIDAVIIATPPDVTASLAVAALEAGKVVLAEKPLAPTLAETAEVGAMPAAADRLQIGLTYRHHPTGGHSQPKGDYVDGSVLPLWPFGFGLSYTTFEVSDLRLDRTEVPAVGGEVRVSVDVVNTGARRGDEVIQLYVRDDEATVARPVLELRGFRRVGLEPAERRTVTFRLSTEQFAYVGVDYRRVIEAGTISIRAGTSSAHLPLSATLTLTGPDVELVDRYRYLTKTTVG